MTLAHNTITPIPNNEPDATPSLWNSRYLEIDENFQGINTTLTAVADSIGAITGSFDGTVFTPTAILTKAMRLDWLYSNNKIALELWRGDYTLISPLTLEVTNVVAGDDSIDVVSSVGVVVGKEYVIYDATHREVFKVLSILSATRIRAVSVLANAYTSTGRISESSIAIVANEGHAVIGDTYFSEKINLGSDSVKRAIVVRAQNNAANIRVYFKDAANINWTECVWEWKRTGDVVPAGYVDIEYPMPSVGDAYLKIVVEIAANNIAHIVGLSAPTGLGGVHNAPAAPVNQSPATNGTGIAERPTLALAAYTSPTGSALSGVQFQIKTSTTGFSTDTGLPSPLHDSGAQPAGLSYQMPGDLLLANTDYYFTGRVKDSTGAWSFWSAPTKFTTMTVYTYVMAPNTTNPVNGLVGVNETPTLSSSAFSLVGGTSTHLASQWQIRSENGAYGAAVDDITNLTTYPVPPGVLLDGEKIYYWRVRHKSASALYSEWSQESKFTTLPVFAKIVGIVLKQTGNNGGVWSQIDKDFVDTILPTSYFDAHGAFNLTPVTIDGQEMIRVPKFYYKRATVQNGKDAWLVSDKPTAGFSVHPAFMNAGVQIDQFYIGVNWAGLNASKMTALSGSGGSSFSYTSALAAAAARNVSGVTGFGILSFWQQSALLLLYLIERKSLTISGDTTYRGILQFGNLSPIAIDGIKAISPAAAVNGVSDVYLHDEIGNKTWIKRYSYNPVPISTANKALTFKKDIGGSFLPDSYVSVTNDATNPIDSRLAPGPTNTDMFFKSSFFVFNMYGSDGGLAANTSAMSGASNITSRLTKV